MCVHMYNMCTHEQGTQKQIVDKGGKRWVGADECGGGQVTNCNFLRKPSVTEGRLYEVLR